VCYRNQSAKARLALGDDWRVRPARELIDRLRALAGEHAVRLVYAPAQRDVMFGIHDYVPFLVASFALHAVPGQDVLFVIAQSLANGRRAGVVGAVGIGAGSLVHTVAVALGVGALIGGVPAALRVVRLGGASYLVLLAMRCVLRAYRGGEAPDTAPAVSGSAASARASSRTSRT
jgi:hypothetical protein